MAEIERTALEKVLIITPKRHSDPRGFFNDTWKAAILPHVGVDVAFIQDNHSHSADAGTLRGLDYQSPPHARAKLVRCARGSIPDVAADVRRGSPSISSAL